MPGMTGIELLEQLRAQNVEIPAIIVTASDDKPTARFARAGVLKTLRKPVDDGKLLHWVEKALASKR
jgi:CheY-like chemotaxis protein